MSRVFVVFLILSLFPAALSAVNCYNENGTNLYPDPGSTYDGCTYNNGITIMFKSGTTASIELNGGTVAVGIWIKCPAAQSLTTPTTTTTTPTSTTMGPPSTTTNSTTTTPTTTTAPTTTMTTATATAATGPFRILVAHLTFKQNAVLNFTGVLPPHSSLRIINNTFQFQRSQPSSVVLSAISIGSAADAMLLHSSTIVMVVNNAVVSSQNTIFAAVCIVGTKLTIQTLARFVVSNNSIRNHVITTGVYVVYMRLHDNEIKYGNHSISNTSIEISNNSSLSIDDNSLLDSFVSGNAYVVYLSLASVVTYTGAASISTSSMSIYGSSFLSMVDNSVSDSHISNDLTVVSLDVTSSSTNSSTSTGTSANSFLNLFIQDLSTLIISSNGIYSVTVAIHAKVVWVSMNSVSTSKNGDSQGTQSWIVSNHSAIVMSDNIIADIVTESASVVLVSLCADVNSIVISGSSVLSATDNRIVNTTTSKKTVVVSLRLGEGLRSLVNLYSSSCINVANNIINISNSVGPQGSVELVWFDFSQMTLRDSSLIFRENMLSSLLNQPLPNGAVIVVSAGNSISLSNSVIEIARNDISTTFPVLFLNLNASVTGSGTGTGTLLVEGNTILASSPNGTYSDGTSAVHLLELTNISEVLVTHNNVSGLYTLLRVNTAAGSGTIIVSANAMAFGSLSISSLAIFESFTFFGGLMHFEDNIIEAAFDYHYTRDFRFLRYGQNFLGAQQATGKPEYNNVSACGNSLSGDLIFEPKKYFEPSNFKVDMCLSPTSISYTASKGDIIPSGQLSGSPSTVNMLVSMGGDTRGSFTAENSASSSNSTFPTTSPTVPMEASKSTTEFMNSSLSANASATFSAANDSISKSRFSRSLSSVGDSITLSMTDTQTVALPVVERHEPILPVAVPAATTATLSAISSSIGGVTAAVDSQVIAAVGLVSCARREDDDDDDTGDLRALSVVALDNTCEGVLLGNTIAIGSAAFLSAVAVAAARIVQVRRYTKAPVGPAPTLITACAMARAPQLLLTFCAYFMSSYALCGLRVGGAGLVAFVFSIIVVVSFPVLTVLFGARRLLSVTYSWQPRVLGSVGSIVCQSWALDPLIDSHKLYGSVFGSFRRLSCVWTLTAHMSFIAGLPMMVATESSGTCGPLFAVSSALFFLFSIIVVAARPRRTTLADILHSLTLLVNGLVTTDATVRLYHLDSHTDTTAMENLGTAITALTVIRLGHTVVSTALNFLAQRSVIPGVEFHKPKDTDFVAEDSLLGLQQDGAPKRKPRPSVCDKLQMPIANFEYSGLLWPLPKEELANEQFTNLQLAMPNSDGDGLLGLVQSLITASVEMTEEAPVAALPRPLPPPLPLPTSARLYNLESQDSSLYLSEEDQFRRELARYYGGRQIDELLLK